jgi:hypothetical protein
MWNKVGDTFSSFVCKNFQLFYCSLLKEYSFCPLNGLSTLVKVKIN